MPIVRDNFSLVAIGIVFVSLLPMVVEYLRHRTGAGSRLWALGAARLCLSQFSRATSSGEVSPKRA